MKRLSQTIYCTGELTNTIKLDYNGLVEIRATVYVPKLFKESDTLIYRSHYFNVPKSYAVLQYYGDPKKLEKSVIRETCYGNCISVGGIEGGALESCIEKLVDGEWKIISGMHYNEND